MASGAKTLMAALGLTTAEWRTVRQRASRLALPPGSLVVASGRRSEALFIVLEGRVQARLGDGHHQATVVSHFTAGDCFGGPGFDDTPPGAALVTAEPCRFLVIPKADLPAFLPPKRRFAAGLFDRLLREIEMEARELEEARQQQGAIRAILRAMAQSPTDIQSLLQSVAQSAAGLCAADDAAIMQVDGDDLRLVAKHGPSQIWPVGSVRPINRRWATGRAVHDRQPVHVPDLVAAEAEFPQGAAYARQYGHRTVFATPLMRDGAAIGAILIRRFEVRPLTENQVALLLTFADQAAIAIEQVRLFTEIEAKSRQVEEQAAALAEWNRELETRVAAQVLELERLSNLEHELSLASEIQTGMLPRALPRLDGFDFCARMVPAKSVGGDFFDFIPLDRGRLAIAVGDVSDKGVPAALFMAMVRTLLRAETHPGGSPGGVLRRVNHHLREVNDKEMFVTVLFGILDGATRRFAYARAGHERPLLMDPRGGVQRLPRTRGRALGVFDEVDLEEQTLALPAGATLLIYSDGISDAMNRERERFGVRGIIRTLGGLVRPTAPTACQRLMDAVGLHQGAERQHDDMTIIALGAL